MKFLIWICCLLPAALLITVIERSGGIILGPLPKTLIAGSAAAIAIKFCKQRDKNKKEEQDDNKDETIELYDENKPNSDECPSCFHKISKIEDECSYCGYKLKRNGGQNNISTDENKFDTICPSETNSIVTREELWKNEELRQKIILNSNDEFALKMRSAINIINVLWDSDTYLDPENKRAESRSKGYMLSITPELFLENYYLFKAGNRDDIKDSIYIERPYPVWETLINMGLYIFETKNNLVVLREIINSDDIEYINSKILAKRILSEELKSR